MVLISKNLCQKIIQTFKGVKYEIRVLSFSVKHASDEGRSRVGPRQRKEYRGKTGLAQVLCQDVDESIHPRVVD